MYNIKIHNQNQPLVEVIQKRRGKEQLIYLVPELCNPTGETDAMKADFQLQKSLGQYKQARACDKLKLQVDFINKLKSDSRELYDNWKIDINKRPIELPLQQIEPGSIKMGNKMLSIQTSNLDRDTQDEMLLNPMLGAGIDRCQIIYSEKSQRIYEDFSRQLQNSSSDIKFKFNDQPRGCMVATYESNDYKNWIKLISKQCQLAIFILPGQKKKGRFYDEIKKHMINDYGIPSQIILEKTIMNQKGLRVVCNKILVQIACKTQGIPYTIKPIPKIFESNPTMVVGIDIYHKRGAKGEIKSVLGFVASIDHYFGKYFSESKLLQSDSDLVNDLQIIMEHAIDSFGKFNKIAPKHIIVYRDGVSQGQFKVLEDSEIPSIQQGIRNFNEKTKDTTLSYIIVNKRVNAQFYKNHMRADEKSAQSAEAGTLITSTQVTEGPNDFYLISQRVRQGCAIPTHYHVLHNEILDSQCESGDIIKEFSIFTFKLCFLYYNYQGSIKVPAPVKYAHILSNFVGDRYNIGDPTSLISVKKEFQNQNSLYFI